MAVLRAFIASSGEAKDLADALYEQLMKMNKTTARLAKQSIGSDTSKNLIQWDIEKWWGPGVGSTTIEKLIKQASEVDLCITILTADDITIKSGENEKIRKPRDNCIFEAGLFMGALGLDRARSVIVTSVEKKSLPSDLLSVEYIEFESPTPEQIKDDKLCIKKAMGKVAEDLHRHAIKLSAPVKRPVFSVLTPKELIEREKPESAGGDLDAADGHSIVINTIQPVDNKISLAKQVIENMDHGIHYIYFFKAARNVANEVVNLIQTLAIASLSEKELTPKKRLELINLNKETVINNIQTLEDNLWIHFLPENRAPLLFCVHNAGVDKKAKCYLRDIESDRFVLWANGKEATEISNDIREFQKDRHDEVIFYSTKEFNLYGIENSWFRRELEIAIENKFGKDLSEKIKPICFRNM
jgi:Predicted nucleotide-binding protein containing TIR-like domain